MKQCFFLLLFTGIGFSAFCQTKAIGLRFNGGNIVAAEISYQQFIADHNRIEASLGFGGGNYFNIVQFTGIYQWVFALDYPLNWYAGIGASAGFWNYSTDFPGYRATGLFLNAAGQIGIEYTFEIPLQVSLDFRPQLGLINSYADGFDGGVGLSLRYIFK